MQVRDASIYHGLQTRGNFAWARLVGVIDIDADLGCSQDNLEVLLQEGRSYSNVPPSACQDRLVVGDLLDLVRQFFTLSP
jgi:hypothetical protein